jgi:hypothetical protein
VKNAILLLIPLWALGCEDYFDSVEDREEYRDTAKSPGGIHFEAYLASDIGTLDAIGARLDAAYYEAGKQFEAKFGYPLAFWLSLPHEERLIFHIIDGVQFPSAGGIMARGEQVGRYVRIVWWGYRYAPDLASVPADAPQHTITPSVKYPGQYVYGVIDDADFAALIYHEMGHFITQDPGFDH